MRREDVSQESLFTTVQLQPFVPADLPLRSIIALIDEALKNLNWLFRTLYAESRREYIPSGRLIRAQLLQVLYSIGKERQLVEQINYTLVYRWFIGLTIDDIVWNDFTFSIIRYSLLENGVIAELHDYICRRDRDNEKSMFELPFH